MSKLSVYTSDDLAAFEETYELESITEQCWFIYTLTEAEKGWLDWIGARCSIADLIFDNLDGNNWSVDVSDVGEALAADGVDRAPYLSEDTQLARLIWFIGPSEDANSNG